MLELSEVVIAELIQDSLGHFQNLEESVVNLLDTIVDEREVVDGDRMIRPREEPHYDEQRLSRRQSNDDVKCDESDSTAVKGQMNRSKYY